MYTPYTKTIKVKYFQSNIVILKEEKKKILEIFNTLNEFNWYIFSIKVNHQMSHIFLFGMYE